MQYGLDMIKQIKKPIVNYNILIKIVIFSLLLLWNDWSRVYLFMLRIVRCFDQKYCQKNIEVFLMIL